MSDFDVQQRLLRAQAMLVVGGQAEEDLFASSVESLLSLCVLVKTSGLSADELISAAVVKYQADSGVVMNTLITDRDGVAIDQPFQPSPEALQLLRDRLQELDPA